MYNKVREYRKLRNLSQRGLAKKVGVSRVSISLIEDGKYENISEHIKLKIATALKVSQKDIFFD